MLPIVIPGALLQFSAMNISVLEQWKRKYLKETREKYWHSAMLLFVLQQRIQRYGFKCLKKNEEGAIKLPATVALGDKAKNVPESTLNIFEDDLRIKTFREIRYEEANDIGYLHFDFYNGAMSTGQCNRLQQAFIAARQRKQK